MSQANFDPDDVHLLLQRVEHDPESKQPPRFPWTWESLNDDEAAALDRLIDVYVASYNHSLATAADELVPPCWRRHDGLARELPVQLWLYYTVHHHSSKATPVSAAEFYSRFLPGFRSRVERYLGASPIECQLGKHPASWRQDLDEKIDTYEQLAGDPDQDTADVERLRSVHFGLVTPPSTPQFSMTGGGRT